MLFSSSAGEASDETCRCPLLGLHCIQEQQRVTKGTHNGTGGRQHEKKSTLGDGAAPEEEGGAGRGSLAFLSAGEWGNKDGRETQLVGD